MFNIAICDDTLEICTQIENIILNYSKNIDVKISVEVFNKSTDLFSYLKKGNKYDLIFLDIEMPEMDGIILSDNIRNYFEDYHTKIVFISKTDMHYMRLFDVQPMHFLLKPFTNDDIIKDLNLALKLSNVNNSSFSYTISKEKYKIPFNEILYFVSDNRKMILTTSDDEVQFYSKIDDVYKKVENHRFIRIHRAFIINYDFIVKITKDSVTMSDGNEFNIGRNYKESAHSKFLQFEKELI